MKIAVNTSPVHLFTKWHVGIFVVHQEEVLALPEMQNFAVVYCWASVSGHTCESPATFNRRA